MNKSKITTRRTIHGDIDIFFEKENESINNMPMRFHHSTEASLVATTLGFLARNNFSRSDLSRIIQENMIRDLPERNIVNRNELNSLMLKVEGERCSRWDHALFGRALASPFYNPDNQNGSEIIFYQNEAEMIIRESFSQKYLDAGFVNKIKKLDIPLSKLFLRRIIEVARADQLDLIRGIDLRLCEN